MKVLITGSSGQIGTNVGLALLDRGDEVIGIDCRPNTWTDGIPTIIVDLTQQSTLSDLDIDKDFDAVLHLAAHAKVYDLILEPRRAFENITMLFPVLEFCRTNKIPMVFGSSREVYGDVHRLITDESQADFMLSSSPYSSSKVCGEAMIYSYALCYDTPCLVFRFSNVYGRYDNDLDRMERVIPLFIDRIKKGQPITIYGPQKILDFTYIDDCVSGVVAGIDALLDEHKSRVVAGKTFNLAYGHGSSLIDVVNLISLSLGKEAIVSFEPSRKGEVTRYVADISKAKALLGYDPKIALSCGIPRAVKWQS